MCNDCRCQNQDRCSIVGYMREGMCCPKCIFYDETHECMKNQAMARQKILEEFEFQRAAREGGY